MVVLLIAPLVAAMLAIVARVAAPRRGSEAPLYTAVAGALVALFVVTVDPGGFFRWFLD
jgi:hypothetical protein